MWWKVSIKDFQKRDRICHALFELGTSGIEEHEDNITAYFSRIEFESGPKLEAAIIKSCGVVNLSIKVQPDEDWDEAWRANFKPVFLPGGIVIKPPWESVEDAKGNLVINISPKMAFGTGTHETTQLCLNSLRRRDLKGSTVLDVGTGSGILAITAAKMGASRVVAIDVEPESLENAAENCALNDCARQVEVSDTSLASMSFRRERFDLIIANIQRSVLETMLSAFIELTAVNGMAILSGLLVAEEVAFVEELKVSGFEIVQLNRDGEWLALEIKPFKNNP